MERETETAELVRSVRKNLRLRDFGGQLQPVFQPLGCGLAAKEPRGLIPKTAALTAQLYMRTIPLATLLAFAAAAPVPSMSAQQRRSLREALNNRCSSGSEGVLIQLRPEEPSTRRRTQSTMSRTRAFADKLLRMGSSGHEGTADGHRRLNNGVHILHVFTGRLVDAVAAELDDAVLEVAPDSVGPSAVTNPVRRISSYCSLGA